MIFQHNNKVKSNFRWREESGAGFTIIELLVVVAIVAVLTGIVMVDVAPYINKAKDAAIRENLSTLLNIGAAYLDSHVDYESFCKDYVIANKPIYDAINTAVGVAPDCVVTTTNDAWCACSVLKTDPTKVYCVSSTNVKKETTNTCKDACDNSGACV